MALRVNTNVVALAAQRNLGISSKGLEGSLKRLSSGLRINSAADDAAGLSIANKLRAQLSGLRVASLNAAQGATLGQVAEGAATEISNILVRLRELAVSAASDQNDSAARTALDAERSALESEIDRISDDTTFNAVGLVDGSFGVSLSSQGASITAAVGIQSIEINGAAASTTFTVSAATATSVTIDDATTSQTVSFNAGDIDAEGETKKLNFTDLGLSITINAAYDSSALGGAVAANTIVTGASSAQDFQVGAFANQNISLSLGDLTTTGLSVTGDVTSKANANTYITTIDSAIDSANTVLGNIGAFKNRMDFAAANLASSVENVASAESTIRDADIAEETTEFTRNQILVQAGVAILAQANISSQSVLSLLR